MALPLDTSDLAGHTGPGCAHVKEAAIRAALRTWATRPKFTAAVGDLRTLLEAACPGVTWTNARMLKAIRAWIEEA